jgi:hypothetical protein
MATIYQFDLNASFNMIRKSKPSALRAGFRGWNTPKQTYLLSKVIIDYLCSLKANFNKQKQTINF